MRPFVHQSLPGRAVFGPGALERVAAEVADLGEPGRVLVIASGSAKRHGDRIAEALGDRFAAAFGEVRQHVPAELAAAATAAARGARADAVVAVGGGSAVGLGKVVAVEREIPLLAVPTTYAGSEMTPIYGLTGGGEGGSAPVGEGGAGPRKRTLRDLRALPRVVVYDPELTVDLPARVSAASGFNALAHAVEGAYAPGASPVVDLWATEAIARLVGALPRVVAEPQDRDARSDALYGAYLAGTCLAVAGTALHHKLCHVLGGSYDLDHAEVHAVVLPHVAAFNAATAPEAMARTAAALGGPAEPGLVGGLLHDLARRIGAPTSLAGIGMPPGRLDDVAAAAVAAVGDSNPRPVDQTTVRRLLEAAYDGRRP